MNATNPFTKTDSSIIAAAIITAAVALYMMNQPLWCRCGHLWLWSGEIWSRHNSQHPLDPYALTHLLHGMLFCGAGALLFGRWLSQRARFALTLAVEAAWEIGENTDTVIQRYRESTISLDYFGDSVVNSTFDVLACAIGFRLAMVLPVRLSIVIFVVLETWLTFWIRDSLVLNTIMLLHPLDWIKEWQMAGAPT